MVQVGPKRGTRGSQDAPKGGAGETRDAYVHPKWKPRDPQGPQRGSKLRHDDLMLTIGGAKIANIAQLDPA